MLVFSQKWHSVSCEYWSFKRQFCSFLTFLGQKLLKTCRKHASGLGQSLKWVDFWWSKREIMKTVGQIGENGGISGMRVWKC